MRHQIHYLNTDLDVVAAFDLHPLASALTARGFFALSVHQREDGCWMAIFETGKTFRAAERGIKAMLAVIEALPAETMRIWSACTVREFNLGYECGNEPPPLSDPLSTTTLLRIAAAGASVRITLYPRRDKDPLPGDSDR